MVDSLDGEFILIFIGIIGFAVIVAFLLLVRTDETSEQRKNETPEQRKNREQDRERARKTAEQQSEMDDRYGDNVAAQKEIIAARNEAIRLRNFGSIFSIGIGDSIAGYHIRPLKWVQMKCDQRSNAEGALSRMAAEMDESANALVKLSFHLRDEKYQAGTGPNGNPYFKNKKIKIWEALACEAVPLTEVDKPKRKWKTDITFVDGSNVIHWGGSPPSLVPLRAVIDILTLEDSRAHIVFDANVGYKLKDRHMSIDELRELLDRDAVIEIVQSGTIADHRLSELANELSASIVTNDLYRDSLRVRHIPKRRGFFVHETAELLEPRA